MTPDPDDEDAFTWEGDEHPTRASLHRSPSADEGATTGAPVRPAPTPEPSAPPAPEPADSGDASVPEAATAEREPMGNVALVASGILGGIYLLYIVGWIIGGLRVSRVAGYLVSTTGEPPAMWASGNVVGVWLAALAPALWFATVWIVSRRSRPWVRWVWLVAGAVLLVPWPLFMLGVQG
ncbi:hypothetical protein LK09_11665 [Microbacterium mangrovi]|uniref:DNA polymerase III subunit gamma/tau n=1 Tax=Microbacterium mangrovi TaxID=1348253 RepID=A0A0B2A794_9MICO|nr:hypothetical protein [Microbacterium mangrovi]KHK97422.1 hypothetical protein LK09_11665 [Microbacterium mangrovi]